MDGVLRCGDKLVDGAKDLMSFLSKNGTGDDAPPKCIILTNECRYTHATIRQQFIEMGSPLPESWSMYTAADSVRDFLVSRLPRLRGVHVVGEQGLFDTLNNALPDKLKKTLPCMDLSEQQSESELYVVIGSLDKQNHNAIEQAAKWIKCGAKVLTTCPDLSDPGSKGDTVISMPYNTLEILKKFVPCHHYCLGKPNHLMIIAALKILRKNEGNGKHRDAGDCESGDSCESGSLNVDPARILFIGDSLDTDIKCAFEAGMKSVLVLTGNTSVFGIKCNVLQPTYVFHSVQELHEVLRSEA